MPDNDLVAEHYTQGTLLAAIRQGVEALGKSPTDVTLEDLSPVEEFHIGGRLASAEFLDQLDPGPEDLVLDVGCGLGGAARFAASRYGCRVSGVDLTEEFIQTGRALNEWLNLQDQVTLEHGSALAIPCADATFDKAYMMHVGMNISDKASLMKELFRVLKPGGYLGVFDIMRTSEGDLAFPVPWAAEETGSALAKPGEYRSALEAAGFELTAERDRHEFAISFFDQLQANTTAAAGPPPLGLHIVMGADAPRKIANMVENVRGALIAPIELFARKR
jgi:SAM-dependent methyltransferase